jgi:hypothetical protein
VRRHALVAAALAGALTIGACTTQSSMVPSNATPAALPDRQAIQNTLYGACYREGKLGSTPTELDSNCRCVARAGEPIVAPEARQAIAVGHGYQGPAPFIGGQEGYVMATLNQCPSVRSVMLSYLRQELDKVCAGTTASDRRDCIDGREHIKLIEQIGAQSTPTTQFPNLEAVAQASLTGSADIYPEGVRGQLINCAAHSLVADIPQGDQERMLSAVNERSISHQDDALFQKWFGKSMVEATAHGQIIGPNSSDPNSYGVVHYADGTAMAPTAPTTLERVRENASRYCPELIGRYSLYFD